VSVAFVLFLLLGCFVVGFGGFLGVEYLYVKLMSYSNRFFLKCLVALLMVFWGLVLFCFACIFCLQGCVCCMYVCVCERDSV